MTQGFATHLKEDSNLAKELGLSRNNNNKYNNTV